MWLLRDDGLKKREVGLGCPRLGTCWIIWFELILVLRASANPVGAFCDHFG